MQLPSHEEPIAAPAAPPEGKLLENLERGDDVGTRQTARPEPVDGQPNILAPRQELHPCPRWSIHRPPRTNADAIFTSSSSRTAMRIVLKLELGAGVEPATTVLQTVPLPFGIPSDLAAGRIRTDIYLLLRQGPLPLGYDGTVPTRNGATGWIRTTIHHDLNVAALPGLPTIA